MDYTRIVHISYAAPYTEDAIRAVLEALEAAVADNWGQIEDDFTDLENRLPVEVEAWVAAAALEKLTPVASVPPEFDIRYSPTFYFDYSPLTAYQAMLMFATWGKRGEAKLEVTVNVASGWGMGDEREGDRMLHKLEVWRAEIPALDGHDTWNDLYQIIQRHFSKPIASTNRAMAWRIAQRLKDVHPIHAFELGQWPQEPPSKS